MVLASTLCSTVLCILIPSIYYTKTSTLSNLQRNPPQINSNNKTVNAPTNLPTPVDLFLRKLAASNHKTNALANGAATDSITSNMSQQPTAWNLGTGRPSIKIYGEGTESRFPPFLEFFLQRIQSFFSVYKYQDTSRPEPGSQIHDVEFINPTKITIPQGGLQRKDEDVEEGVPFKYTGTEADDDYDDDILGDNAGVISVRSDFL